MRLFVVLVLMLFVAVPAHAQTDITIVGTLLGVEGPVSLATPDAEPKPLKLKDTVHMNDVIETGVGARAFILLIDNTELTLGENAQLTIDDYVFDENNTSSNKGRYSILRGAFLYTSGLIAKKENPDVTVNTPYGAVGIRGTTFWGGDIDGEYGILVTEGRVSVETGRGRIFVDKGQGTSLRSKTSIPARAAAWESQKIDRAVQTIALKDATGVRERVTQQAEPQKAQRLKHKEFIQQRRDQKKLDTPPGTPTKRIDNAPRPAEKTEIEPKKVLQQPATLKTKITKPAVLDDAAPVPVPAPAQENKLNEPLEKKDTSTETLLKKAPTDTKALDQNRRHQPMIRRQPNTGTPAPVDTRSKAAGAL